MNVLIIILVAAIAALALVTWSNHFEVDPATRRPVPMRDSWLAGVRSVRTWTWFEWIFVLTLVALFVVNELERLVRRRS
jgi:hypothetical protein